MPSIGEMMRNGWRPILGDNLADGVAATFDRLEKEVVKSTADQIIASRKLKIGECSQDLVDDKIQIMWQRVTELAHPLNPGERDLGKAIHAETRKRLADLSDDDLKKVASGTKEIHIKD